MKRSKEVTQNVIVIVVSLLIFQIIYGIDRLNPSNVEWLLINIDLPTHYLGWEFFRNTPWTFPIIGTMQGIYYPFETSVGFTDSIPLLAIFFKIFKFILPVDFQYIGLWLFLSFAINYYYANKLVKKIFRLENQVWASLSISLFIAFNPVIFFRLGHPALCGHWLFLGIIYEFYNQKDPNSLKNAFIHLILSSCIHPYLTFICFILFNSLAISIYRKERFSAQQFLLYFSQIFILLIWYMLGFFSFPINSGKIIHHMYLDCSFNLNSLFNSHGLSIMVDGLKVYKPMQYEGFAFLGIVVILILFFVLFSIWFRGIPKKVELFDTIDKWLLFGVTLLVLHSISHEVSFGDVLLFKIKFNDVIKDKFEIFRSIGRFFWPAYYLIVIYIMKAFYHVFTKNQVVLVMFMLLTFIAQMFDQRAIFGMYQDPKFMESAIRSDPSHWDEVLKDKKVMFLYPGYQKEYAFGGDYVNLLYVAHRHHMAINTGYLARTNKEMVKIMGDSLLYNICMGKISKNAVYITTEANQRWFLPGVESNLLKRFKIDNYIVFVPTGKSKPKNDSVHYDPSFFFSNFISNVDAKERIFVNKGVESLIQYGPFVPLYAGKYKISYILQAEINNVHSKICGVEITSKSGSSLIASKDFFSSDFKTNLPQNFDITIQLDSLTEACEFKVISSGSVALTSLGVNLIRLND